MDYITGPVRGKLSNDPYEISYDDIRMMYEENLLDARECREVTQSSNRGESYYSSDGRPGDGKMAHWFAAFAKEFLYRDPKTDGFVLQYPHGRVIRQGERRHYYRGEKKIYPSTQPLLLRTLEDYATEEERELRRFIANLRIAEFADFINQFDITQYWAQNCGDVLYEPLAQHYGLETQWLDITNDFTTALFFATCGWDKEKKEWYPLTIAQTEGGECSKYGVIFHAPYWNVTGPIAYFDKNLVLPIGYQPFMRCHYQYGYAIHMAQPFPLQQDLKFEELRFRHNEKLSRDVFELMDGGKKIYPQEGLRDFEDILEDIQNATSFSAEIFHAVFESKNLYFKDKDHLLKLLERTCVNGRPIEIGSHPYQLSQERRNRMNQKCEGFSVEKDLGIILSTRMVCRPPASD